MSESADPPNTRSRILAVSAPYAITILALMALAALLPAGRHTDASQDDIARQAGLRVLGAARGYATTALWLRAGDAYRRGDYLETLAAYQLIAELQPRNPAVYSYTAWNQAYNISAPYPEREKRVEWVIRGLATLHLGQDRMPREASLRMDEWHLLLNRTAIYPLELLWAAQKRHATADKRWSLVVSDLRRQLEELPPADREQLDAFLDEHGLHAAALAMLGNAQEEWERELALAYSALDPRIQQLLALTHWCRMHAMMLALQPALRMTPRPASVEIALVNTVRLAWLGCDDALLEIYGKEYREVVARAVRAGIENARRVGGDEQVAYFLSHVAENLSDVPGLAPD